MRKKWITVLQLPKFRLSLAQIKDAKWFCIPPPWFEFCSFTEVEVVHAGNTRRWHLIYYPGVCIFPFIMKYQQQILQNTSGGGYDLKCTLKQAFACCCEFCLWNISLLKLKMGPLVAVLKFCWWLEMEAQFMHSDGRERFCNSMAKKKASPLPSEWSKLYVWAPKHRGAWFDLFFSF